MSKKWIITLCAVGFVLATMLILFWTLFGLSSVSVQFNSSRINLIVSEKEIVDAGKFHYGASVLFEGKNRSIENINQYASQNENFAYIKVVNIETVFPNKFVVHVIEREELFAVQHTSGELTEYLICDRDFRVLKKTNSVEESEGSAKPILLTGLEIEGKGEIAVGDFLNIKQSGMKKFYSSMLKNNRDLAEIKGKFKELSLGQNVDEFEKTYVSLKLVTDSGVFVINNIDFALTNKMQLMFSVESALFSYETDEDGNFLDKDGQKIMLTKSETGEYVPYVSSENEEDNPQEKVALSYELLSKCFIKVDNLPLGEFVSRTEKDIYYSICDLSVL